jgi:hypothetical protein
LFRTHKLTHDPIHFGRSGRNRFDDNEGDFGVLYAGADPYCAFIETFGQQTGIRTISTGELRNYGLAELAPKRRLRLLDLTRPGALARIGADSRLFAGEYAVAQRWARAFYTHPYLQLDGILYAARHDPTRFAIAVYERAPEIALVQSTPWHDSAGTLRALLAQVLDCYGFSLIETISHPEKKLPGKARDQYDLW